LCRLLTLQPGEYVAMDSAGPPLVLLRCKAPFQLLEYGLKRGEKNTIFRLNAACSWYEVWIGVMRPSLHAIPIKRYLQSK
ncbi:MAG: hypothetical protein KC588_17985, partial [Nitrospira sp.]|nr:hypothetical protein [Nitrospira sp.]